MEQQYCSRFHQTVHLKHSEEELEADQGERGQFPVYLNERKVESAFPGQTRLYKQTEDGGLGGLKLDFEMQN